MSTPSHPASIHHVAGVDDRERGFNRQVHMIISGNGYQARFWYEQLQVEIDPAPMEDQALHRLIQVLHEKGYRQLRTQRIFNGNRYLGNQELWVDYPDPMIIPESKGTWWGRLRRIFERSST